MEEEKGRKNEVGKECAGEMQIQGELDEEWETWSCTDKFYNRDEPSTFFVLSEKEPKAKDHILWFSLFKISQIDKSIWQRTR